MNTAAPSPYAPPPNTDLPETAPPPPAPRLRRIGACLFNYALFMLVWLPVLITLEPKWRSLTLSMLVWNPYTPPPVLWLLHYSNNGTAAGLSMVLLTLLLLVQAALLAVRGQSLGKMLFGLKIVGANGERAGFWRLVVVREAGFYFCLLLASSLPLLFFSSWESELVQTRYVRPLLLALCLLMLCVGRRRTLQDMLAGTAVADARRPR